MSLERTPRKDLPITLNELDDPVGWNRSSESPVSFRQYIAGRTEDQALFLGIVFESDTNIVDVTELTDDDIRKAELIKIEQGPDDTGMVEPWTNKKMDNAYLRQELFDNNHVIPTIRHQYEIRQEAAQAGVVRIVSPQEQRRLFHEHYEASNRRFFPERKPVPYEPDLTMPIDPNEDY